jgi:hypothetical protein
MYILNAILDFLFGCRHHDLSRPFTVQHHTYKVCLDCGHEMPYSLTSMRLMTGRELRHQPSLRPAINVVPFHAVQTLNLSQAPALRKSNVAA